MGKVWAISGFRSSAINGFTLVVLSDGEAKSSKGYLVGVVLDCPFRVIVEGR